ncbi:unnamed protein product [Trichobilharzia szidati]|nr:unnamed protein product [Trichobilharzia szidati]
METDDLNTSVAFEIRIRDQIRSPSSVRVSSSRNRAPLSEIDLTEKLEKASQRRSSVLAETVNKSEQHVQLVKARIEQGKEKIINRSNEIMENLAEDLALKSSRRQQIIDKIVTSNKKEVERAKLLADARSSPQRSLLQQINDDMSNKENNRRSYIQNIVQQCQSEIEKVESARSRRSANNSSAD